MIAVFKIRESFSYTDEQGSLIGNCRLFSESFPAEICDFFYYLKPSDPVRYFIVRMENADREDFVKMATVFAANMNFLYLAPVEANRILKTMDLEAFC